MCGLVELVERLASPIWDGAPTTTPISLDESLEPPNNAALIAEDIAGHLALWKVLSICDPMRQDSFLAAYKTLRDGLVDQFGLAHEVAQECASRLASALMKMFSERKQARRSLDRKVRAELLDMQVGPPRCWYCGVPFTGDQVDAFFGGSRQASREPVFFDFVTPRGLSYRDLQIEVDHLNPFAKSGDEEVGNLRLACGWCNTRKSDFRNLFDVRGAIRTFHHPAMGNMLVPLPFWSLRFLGTHRRCDAIGCERSLATDHLYVGARVSGGAMVPGNLGAFCGDHDTLRRFRHLPRRAFEVDPARNAGKASLKPDPVSRAVSVW